MALTDPKAKKAAPKERDYKISDEKGLYLLVTKKGGKYWRMKYRFAGKEKTLAIGVYPEVTLKEAREKRDEARKMLADNLDPSAMKKQAKRQLVEEDALAFERIALQWYEITKSKWSDTHANRVHKIIKNELGPSIGHITIGKVTAPQLLEAIRKIEAREAYETAAKTRRVAGQIFRYGIASGLCQYDLAASITDAMQHVETTHMAAITEPKELGRLLASFEFFNGTPTVGAALRLSPMLFQRPGEIRHMEWAELDLDAARWEIPSHKMKMRQEHIVPLPTQAIEILKELVPLTGRGKYVFPNPRGASRPMSENAVRIALRNLGYDKDTITPHGFRATARTLLDEVLGFRIDWIEQQLAHAVKDATGRAYNRTKYLEGRQQMMQRWADYLDELKAQAEAKNVVTGDFRKDGAG